MRRIAAAALGLLTLLAGCTAAGGTTAPPAGDSPLADCAALPTPPGPAPTPAAPTPPPDEQAGEPLPAVTLPCFTGGEPFPLPDLAGPAVVNLWASWCGPCREELPLLQQLADATAGRLHVVGVVTADARDPAAALAEDLAISFPALYDREEELLAALGRRALPVTLLVDPAGRIGYVHHGPAYDRAELADLVATQLGVHW